MTRYQKTIFVGDTSEYLSQEAKKHDASAWLLDRHNHKDFKKSQDRDITVYTSLGDLPKDLVEVYDILCQADTIYYCPPEVWSDDKQLDVSDPTSSMHGLTETLLLLLPNAIEIKSLKPFVNLSDCDPRPLVDNRKTDDAQMWVAGCSISHGIGVMPHERYGHLLSQDLGMPCSFLTRPGSAIDWAADQILRSDIRKNDSVIWGLTSWERLTYIHDHQLMSGINVKTYEKYPEYAKIVDINNLFSQQTLYNHFYSIKQVINHCEKIGSKLFLVGLLHSNYSLLGFLKTQKNYIHIPYQIQYQESLLFYEFEDLGIDDSHPGPKQHQTYKDIILKHINQ